MVQFTFDKCRFNCYDRVMLGNLIKGLTDLIYPKHCLVCKQSLKNKAAVDELICRECWKKIKLNLPPFCHFCGRQLDKKTFTKHICPACVRKKVHFDRAFSPCSYEGIIKELIHEFKYKNKDYLGRTLTRPMISFIKEYNLPIDHCDFIVPVPLHESRLREREFNQAEVLSRHIGDEFNKEIFSAGLMRHKPTKTQTELLEHERFSNVKDSFLVKDAQKIKGKNILLVDDVLTTAATSSEAALALKNAGANIVFVLTLAN